MVERRQSLRREEDRDQYVRRDELALVVKDAVVGAFRDYQHECLFGFDFSPSDVKQVENMMFAIKELGDGDMAKGVQVVRGNHEFISRYKDYTGRAGTAMFTVIIIGVLGIVGSAIVAGTIAWVRQITKG